MKQRELLSHRVSYQVLITFDLFRADPSAYELVRKILTMELELEKSIYLSKDQGGKAVALPCNTLVALWTKDSTEQETRDYFVQKMKKAFRDNGLKGRYVILVAQNWAVAAGKF